MMLYLAVICSFDCCWVGVAVVDRKLKFGRIYGARCVVVRRRIYKIRSDKAAIFCHIMAINRKIPRPATIVKVCRKCFLKKNKSNIHPKHRSGVQISEREEGGTTNYCTTVRSARELFLTMSSVVTVIIHIYSILFLYPLPSPRTTYQVNPHANDRL